MDAVVDTRHETAERLAVAERIARSAGRMAQGFRRRSGALTIEAKRSAQDLVSEADRSVERHLRRAIAKSFPDDAVIGEEAGTTAGQSRFAWVIDPIDGTMPFLVGQPNWTISVAVVCDGEPVAGVVHAPMLRETYTARDGCGAALNGRPLILNPDWTIRSSAIGFGANDRADPEGAGRFVTGLYAEGGVMFRVGSGALMLAYVASNRLAGYYDPTVYAWDSLAGVVLIREAGGRAEFAGSLAAPGPLWAGNAAVYEALKRLSGAG